MSCLISNLDTFCGTSSSLSIGGYLAPGSVGLTFTGSAHILPEYPLILILGVSLNRVGKISIIKIKFFY